MLESTQSFNERLRRSVNVVHNPVIGWFVLAISLILTFAAYWIANHQVEVRAHDRFHFRTVEISDAIQERLLMYEQALRGGVGLFDASEFVSRGEWRAYVDSLNLKKRLPGIQGLGVSIPVLPSEKAAVIERVRAEGFPEFSIVPEGERSLYSTIIYLEPFDWRNKRAFGYDMWSNDMRQQAMMRARDTGEPATSGIITLVQETAKDVQRGFLTYLPVYDVLPMPITVEERREHFFGWVYAAFRAGDLMAGILGATDREIAFEIYDGEAPSEETLLYDSDGYLSISRGTADHLFTHTEKLLLQGRPWTIYYSVPFGEAYHSEESHQPFYVLIAAIFIDSMLFYVLISLHLINRHAREAERELKQKFELNQQSLALQARLVEATEKESETFFELAPEAFLVVAADGNIVRANHTAHKLFGFELGTLTRVNVDQLVPLDVTERHAALRSSFIQNPQARLLGADVSLVAVKQNGESFPVTVNLVPIEYRGALHTVAAIHDITQQKHIEQTLAEAKEKAEAGSRSKSEFVANMSHEIRTPLNAVLGAAQLLTKTEPNSDQQKYIHMIRSSGEALLGVINDILDFSKIEAGCMELSPVDFNLDDILSRVAIMMSVNSGEKDIELVIDVDNAVKTQLVGDPLRLQQVLINLVSNAIKFTDKGAVVLMVTTQGLTETDHQRLRFTVKDSGIGMNMDQQARLFKAFFQADGSITRRFGGTGLGLVISNKIVEMMGSRLKIQSELGQGSNFYFDIVLPFRESASRDKLSSEQVFKVLILDDNQDTGQSLTHLFQRWSWQITLIDSWQACITAPNLADLLANADFLLIDRTFCGLNSQDCIRQLRSMGLTDATATVLLLANNQQDMALSDTQPIFHGKLIKPLLASSVIEGLNTAWVAATGKHLILTSSESPLRSRKFSGVKALLVEDNVFNQTIAQGLLEDLGVIYDVVNNGQEAVRQFQLAGDSYDVIFMDIQMPVMDGVSATQILRHQLHCKLPIIAMTAGVLKSEQEQYLDAGMDDFVPKPIDSNDLFRAIHKVLPADRLSRCGTPDTAEVGNNINRPSPASLTASTGLHHLNEARIMSFTKGKSERMAAMAKSLQTICKSGDKTIAEGVLALQNGDTAEAQFVFHSLKGVLANYGAEILADRIKQLEGQMQENIALAQLLQTVTVIRQDFAEFVAAVDAWVGSLTGSLQDGSE